MSSSGSALVIGTDDGSIGGLAAVLRTSGLAVRTASDGVELLVARALPSIVVLSGRPADRDPADLARALRTRHGAACPILVWIPTAEPRRVELSQFDDVVRRPYRASDLLARVQRLLRASGTMPVARETWAQRRAR